MRGKLVMSSLVSCRGRSCCIMLVMLHLMLLQGYRGQGDAVRQVFRETLFSAGTRLTLSCYLLLTLHDFPCLQFVTWAARASPRL